MLTDSFTGFFRAMRQLRLLGDAISHDALRICWTMPKQSSTALLPRLLTVLRKRDVPSFMVYYLPLDPSRELVPAYIGMSRRRGPLFNRLASGIAYRLPGRILGRWLKAAPPRTVAATAAVLRTAGGICPAVPAGDLRVQSDGRAQAERLAQRHSCRRF